MPYDFLKKLRNFFFYKSNHMVLKTNLNNLYITISVKFGS